MIYRKLIFVIPNSVITHSTFNFYTILIIRKVTLALGLVLFSDEFDFRIYTK